MDGVCATGNRSRLDEQSTFVGPKSQFMRRLLRRIPENRSDATQFRDPCSPPRGSSGLQRNIHCIPMRFINSISARPSPISKRLRNDAVYARKSIQLRETEYASETTTGKLYVLRFHSWRKQSFSTRRNTILDDKLFGRIKSVRFEETFNVKLWKLNFNRWRKVSFATHEIYHMEVTYTILRYSRRSLLGENWPTLRLFSR